MELYLPLASFPASFGPFNRPGCLLYWDCTWRRGLPNSRGHMVQYG